MDAFEKGNVPMLSGKYLQVDGNDNPQSRRFTSRMHSSTSISIPMNSLDSYEIENNFVSHTGPLRSERRTPIIQMSGPLYTNSKNENLFQTTQGAIGSTSTKATVEKCPSTKEVNQIDWPNNNSGWKNEHLLRSAQLGMCNDPYCTCLTHFKEQQKNTKASGLSEQKFHNDDDAKGWVMDPDAKIVQQWNKFFVISCLVAVFLDPLFFFLFSVKQDNKCIVIKKTMKTTLVVFRSMTDFIYLLHMLLQRVNQCVRDACRNSGIANCTTFIDCGQGSEAEIFKNYSSWRTWKNNVNASACINGGGSFFEYGIYGQAVNLTATSNLFTRYVYSLFWGFQQISTLAGNQTPGFSIWEVLFTTGIIIVGLLLFALLIGNMQNCLQALGRRRLEMLLRHRDFKQG